MEMKNMHDPANWKFSSPTTPGWHLVVGPDTSIPEGYHPTVASPNIASSYFWLMAAHRPASRRYDLAVTDPAFA